MCKRKKKKNVILKVSDPLKEVRQRTGFAAWGPPPHRDFPSHGARRSSHPAPPPAANELEGMFTFCRSTRKRYCQSRLDCV